MDARRAIGPSERTAYLHVGTHKTGTTAIQGLLRELAPDLAGHGFLYPQSGIFIAGHHNLVFELTGDERFDPGAGTWSGLCHEIEGSRAHRICLSSEAFGYLNEQQRDLERIRDTLRDLGYRSVVVLYVRSQIEYAESLFAELAKHRNAGTFEEFLEVVCTTGSFRHRPYGCEEVYTFAYDRLAANFARVFGEDRVIVRPYSPNPGIVCADLLRLIAPSFDVDRIPSAQLEQVINGRETLPTVIRRLFQNTDERSGLTEIARAMLDQLSSHDAALGDAPFEPMTLGQVAEVERVFAANNAALREKWGVALPSAPADTTLPTWLSHRLSARAVTARALFAAYERVRNV